MSEKTRLTKAAATLALAMFLAACGSKGTEEPAVATVREVFEDKAPMGCMGTDWGTLVRLEDGRVARLCGRWGKPGDKINGCWVSGATGDYTAANGFRIHCASAIRREADPK